MLATMLLSLVTCGLFDPDTGESDTYTFISSSIRHLSTVLIYYPEDYTTSTPVIYLLNGWGTDAYNWGSGMDLAQEAFDRDIIFVSMSAGENTYANDPNNSNESYEDYVLEVISKVENKYDLDIDSTRRAICGISNGGGGAVFLLSEHPSLFSGCGSLSGTHYTQMEQFTNFAGKGIRIDVGTEDDEVLSELRWQHNKFNEEGVEHEYFEHPGAHNWTFWKKYAPKQFDFLENLISH